MLLSSNHLSAPAVILSPSPFCTISKFSTLVAFSNLLRSITWTSHHGRKARQSELRSPWPIRLLAIARGCLYVSHRQDFSGHDKKLNNMTIADLTMSSGQNFLCNFDRSPSETKGQTTNLLQMGCVQCIPHHDFTTE